MAFDMLPPEEPGDELTEISPGFTDRLMQRIDNYQRQRRRRRLLAILLTVVALVAAVSVFYTLRTRRADGGRKQGAVSTQPRPAATLVPQPPSQQNAVKRGTLVSPTVTYAPPLGPEVEGHNG